VETGESRVLSGNGPNHTNLQVIRLNRNLLFKVPVLHLIHIPMRRQDSPMSKSGFLGSCPYGKLATQPLCTTINIRTNQRSTWLRHKIDKTKTQDTKGWSKSGVSRTVIPSPSIFRDVVRNCKFRPDPSRVVADNLHFVRVCVQGNLLEEKSSGVFGESVGGNQGGFGA